MSESGNNKGEVATEFRDAGRLRNMVAELYHHVYCHYEELEEEGINEMVDEGLVLEMDIIEYNHKKEIEKKIEETTATLVRNANASVHDPKKVAELLQLPYEEVTSILNSEE